VAGGVHGRSVASGAASTVSRAPLTVIWAPSMASTARTPPSRLIRSRSAPVSPPDTEAITSGTIRRVADSPAVPGPCGPVLPGDAVRAGDAVLPGDVLPPGDPLACGAGTDARPAAAGSPPGPW